MFAKSYQGGAVFEIFSGQGKDPVAKWKLCGGPSAIHKEFDKDVKGFVYCLEGCSQTVQMQMPESRKMSLGLLQRFLVLQVNVPQGEDFSIELMITDSEHMKRRLHISTVQKELSFNPLHAKIPFAGMIRDIWYNLCIDLVSFSETLFKGFSTLDVITLFATCKVRRIFTMKTEPSGMSDDDSIPRGCHFPPHVNHVTQVLKMENLQKADMRAGLSTPDCRVPGQSASARTTGYGRTRPQGVVQTASGSKVSGPSRQTGKKSSTVSDGVNRRVLPISNMESSASTVSQKVAAESQSIASLSENLLHGEPSHIHPEDFVPGDHMKSSKTRERCTPPSTPPSSREESRQQPLNQRTQHLMADECSNSLDEESSRAALTSAEPLPCLNCPDLACRLQIYSSWENNGSEPQLALQKEVFTFPSQPHSPKGEQDESDQEKMEMGNDQVQSKSRTRHEGLPEDNFIGSESDEDTNCAAFKHQRTSVESNPASPTCPSPTLDVQLEVCPESHEQRESRAPRELSPPPTSEKAKLARIVPKRCHSPCFKLIRQCGPHESGIESHVVSGNNSVSLLRRELQEVPLDDFKQLKEEDDQTPTPADSSGSDLSGLSGLRIHWDDEEELRMLSSLKRQLDEDECRASGLSASQIHQCNVSISMSSDDASSWTMPANQGHHYQTEMSPLLQSNPREWMDVLSPPINPPSQQRRSGRTWDNPDNLVGGEHEEVNEEENDDEYLNLLYDPALKKYFDPETRKYYELA